MKGVDPWTALPISLLVVAVATIATVRDAAPVPQPSPDAAVRERACRWEVVAGTPWRDGPSGGGPAQPVTLLLD